MFDPTETPFGDALSHQARGPFWLGTEIGFPPAGLGNEYGLVAMGGDLRPARLLSAYSSGIFPWPLLGDDSPLMWWSPDPRCLLYLHELRVSRSLRKTLRRGHYEVRFDTAFEQVIDYCASAGRRDQEGSWITPAMAVAYTELYRLGFVHSVEAYRDGRLMGGLYGVSLGGVFFGESMFAKASDASKVALVHLVERLKDWQFDFIDCQQDTDHLVSLGARRVPIEDFLTGLTDSLKKPNRAHQWKSSAKARPREERGQGTDVQGNLPRPPERT